MWNYSLWYSYFQGVYVHFVERFFGMATITITPESPIVGIIHGMAPITDLRQFNIFHELDLFPMTYQTIDAFVRAF
jgi:hypothetical protein